MRYDQLTSALAGVEFGRAFTVHADQTVTFPQIYNTPEVIYHDEVSDVDLGGWDIDGWRPLTNLTSQWGYYGAVMHPSEQLGGGLVERLLTMAEQSGSATFAVVLVDAMPEVDLDGFEVGEIETIGWAVLHLDTCEA